MYRSVGLSLLGSAVGVILAMATGGTLQAQISAGGFITGAAAQAWEHWDAALRANLARDQGKAEEAFGELLALQPSPLRIALLADYSINRATSGAAVRAFEEAAASEALGPNGTLVAELLATGRERMNEADDGWYFSQIGRFDVANANFQALLEADPDPVALLEFADRVPRRRQILIQLIDNPIVGQAVRDILKLLDEGEVAIKADPTRIKENIERLAGPPRAFENASEALIDSGEYAAAMMVQALRYGDPERLREPILRVLPRIDRPAINPLVTVLNVPHESGKAGNYITDDAIKRDVIETLGKIGYWQAVPYLLRIDQAPGTSREVRQSVASALADLRARGVDVDPSRPAADAFFELAEDYYQDNAALAADPRLPQANVWYLRGELLLNVPVPTDIFNEVMCMRSCEAALELDPGMKPALALWIAANFRRTAQLPAGAQDRTRPPNWPPAAYFAQSAGTDYCLRALARAVDNNEPAVALGAIAALRKIAGPASLLTDAEGRLPLAEALSSPDRMVRIQAGLTLGHARPTQAFHNYQNLMPVLSEALMLYGGARNALVVDPDQASANAVAGVLRQLGYEVLVDPSLYPGLQKVRADLPSVDVIFIASDVRDPALVPGLKALRSEFRFSATPVIVIAKPGDGIMVEDLVQADYRLDAIGQNTTAEAVTAAIDRVSQATGAQSITPEVGAVLALDAAGVLQLLALTNNPLFDVAEAEPALLAAFGTEDPTLRLAIAEVLGYLGSSQAQEAIAQVALNPDVPEDMRVKMFTALANAAKRRGNLLPQPTADQVLAIAQTDENMTIREAASRTLGALNLPSEQASEIVLDQYQRPSE